MTGHDVLVSNERKGEFSRRSTNKSLYIAWNRKMLSYIHVSYTIAENTSHFLSLTIGNARECVFTGTRVHHLQ